MHGSRVGMQETEIKNKIALVKWHHIPLHSSLAFVKQKSTSVPASATPAPCENTLHVKDGFQADGTSAQVLCPYCPIDSPHGSSGRFFCADNSVLQFNTTRHLRQHTPWLSTSKYIHRLRSSCWPTDSVLKGDVLETPSATAGLWPERDKIRGLQPASSPLDGARSYV